MQNGKCRNFRELKQNLKRLQPSEMQQQGKMKDKILAKITRKKDDLNRQETNPKPLPEENKKLILGKDNHADTKRTKWNDKKISRQNGEHFTNIKKGKKNVRRTSNQSDRNNKLRNDEATKNRREIGESSHLLRFPRTLLLLLRHGRRRRRLTPSHSSTSLAVTHA